MDRIYNDAKDKNVSAVVIYGKTNKAYSDKECTVQMTTSELCEAFKKRGVIDISGKLYAPLSYSVASDVGSVIYVDPKSGEATTAVLGSLSAAKDA
nr:MAG TPA: hypothetical protein [Caudoviricetes sp.]